MRFFTDFFDDFSDFNKAFNNNWGWTTLKITEDSNTIYKVKETETGVVLEFTIPGVAKENVKVDHTVKTDVAVDSFNIEAKNDNYSYSFNFEWTEFPVKSVKAKVENGILYLMLEKPEETKAISTTKEIEIE